MYFVGSVGGLELDSNHDPDSAHVFGVRYDFDAQSKAYLIAAGGHNVAARRVLQHGVQHAFGRASVELNGKALERLTKVTHFPAVPPSPPHTHIYIN